MPTLSQTRVAEDVLTEFNVYTVDQYCAAEKVSRAKLYNEWREGGGPRYFLRGNRRLITVEAARDYRRQLEALAEAQRVASRRIVEPSTAG